MSPKARDMGHPAETLTEGRDRTRGWLVRLAALAAALGAVFYPAAWGLSPVTPLAELHRQGWAMENGLPQNTVQALAQTRDGFLWLGTEVGLVRFDGVGFAVFDRNTKPALPGNDVRDLLAAPDGALWIGTGRGLARLRNGAVTTWTAANGLPADGVRKIAIKDGVVTVWTDGGAAEIRGGRAVVSNAKMPGPGGSVARIVSELEAEKILPGTRVQAELVDREGALWIGTNRGLVRVVNGRVDRLPVTDPLAAASVMALLEDREGNLWVGTENGGLDVLRDRRFESVGAHEGLSTDATTAVTEDSEGKLWVGTNGGGLNVLRLGPAMPGEAPTYALPDVLLSSVVTALAAGKNDELWVGTPNGLNRLRGSAIDAFTTADGLPDNYIHSLLVDRDGSVWIGTRRGLAHWTLGPDGRTIARKRNYSQASGLGSDWIGAMARDTHGDLWIATQAGLSRMRGGRITNFSTANGLSSNAVTTLLARPGGMLLVGTEDHGWDVWDGRDRNGQDFRQVKDAGSELAAIHAILDDRLGHLWLETGTGIARCDANGLEDAACPHWIEFGPADGLLSREMATNGQPAVWRSADGRLWFATPRGLAVVNPAHFPLNTLPPPVAIERFVVDDAEMPLGGAGALLRVPAGKVHFEFDYAAMSFVAPQKVRYRYMLEGFDHGWIDAGTRRMAYYTNLPPGTYTFRVQAANNDGVWNLEGASLRFELRPHFYQTVWCYVALGAGAVLLAALVVFVLSRLRLRRAEREFRAVLGERERIAREIHDTLAQGYVGVSVQLEVLSELLRRNRMEAAQKQLDVARESVRAGLNDARQSIWTLRSQDAGETALPVRLRRMVEQAGGKKLDAEFGVYGVYRALKPEMEREILRVAQEAIQNGKRHAGAQHLWVRLEYTPAEVALEVRDDGAGFALNGRPDHVQSPPGHFGLTGMRERAEEMGGTLRIESAEGEGTTVRLRVPAGTEAEEEKEPA